MASPVSDRPTAPVDASSLDLLRQFEPVVYFTKGEQFFPTDIESYVRDCSLWEHNPDGRDELLVKHGELTTEKLVENRPAPFGAVRYLRYIEPLSLTEAAQMLGKQARLRRRLGYHFHAGIGRLARGGFLPRLMDGLFSLSFLLRGKVPAATAAAAEIDYNETFKEDPKFVYYGRVANQNGWTVLQYWFFSSFDSWRSGFHGVNDHEADWEMINIYLYEDSGRLVPEWLGYASHDFKGDDLRRRWDDRGQVDLEDGHPVVYAGAGSHSSYYRRGEFQAEVSLPMPSWVSEALHAWNKFWTESLGQQAGNLFRIPFIDYARGDGLAVGPGKSHAWSPVLIDESTHWVSRFRGLWGLFARDPISGENAPAGPMYNRDGSPRGTWYDPLGFAGLDKVPPPPQALQRLDKDCKEIIRRQEELERLIPEKADELQSLGIKLKGMEGNPHLAKLYAALEKNLAAQAEEVKELRRERVENIALLQGLTEQFERLKAGEKGDPRAHIHHLVTPDQPGPVFRFDRAAETWAAVSLSLLLFAVAALIFFAPHYFWAGLAIILILFVVADSTLRGAIIQTIGRVTLILAMVAALILLIHFWKWVLIAGLAVMAASLMVQRLRELTK
ncbi:MAG: hypothetical protein ABSB41_15940 [Anaerolineales bacterium]|jgi:hypothetical protein